MPYLRQTCHQGKLVCQRNPYKIEVACQRLQATARMRCSWSEAGVKFEWAYDVHRDAGKVRVVRIDHDIACFRYDY